MVYAVCCYVEKACFQPRPKCWKDCSDVVCVGHVGEDQCIPATLTGATLILYRFRSHERRVSRYQYDKRQSGLASALCTHIEAPCSTRNHIISCSTGLDFVVISRQGRTRCRKVYGLFYLRRSRLTTPTHAISPLFTFCQTRCVRRCWRSGFSKCVSTK